MLERFKKVSRERVREDKREKEKKRENGRVCARDKK